ncbi:UNVERIFIED_CONTAM: Metalloendoproteinase 5-MMP [Sesamum calycinum]|uniref:Metalloendoproteinase 5-MMP n=1 Tax=Sesamum calycinum TaxID=2727403 RepID=A0AAW2NHE6_9LAMI
MEPKFLQLLSCILLLLLPNPFSLFTHAADPPDAQKPSAMDFLQTLIGARKGTTSKGISQLKKYLSHLGYMNRDDDDQTNDFFDDNLELAVKRYQTSFKREVNGIMDANTIAKMSRTRCGVPDHYSHNRSHELYLHIPTFSSHYTFFPGEPKWPATKRNLTYSFKPGTRADVHNPILHATQMWANVSHFRFTHIHNDMAFILMR